MVQYPPNYKEQESYYASQEYKDGVEKALETNNKLPTFEESVYASKGKRTTPRRRVQKMAPLSYPVASGPSQRTGERLVIKSLKFEPPALGTGANVTATNLFKKSLASIAFSGSEFFPFNSGVSIQANLIFSPSTAVHVSPS